MPLIFSDTYGNPMLSLTQINKSWHQYPASAPNTACCGLAASVMAPSVMAQGIAEGFENLRRDGHSG
jgi:hypothetical protein